MEKKDKTIKTEGNELKESFITEKALNSKLKKLGKDTDKKLDAFLERMQGIMSSSPSNSKRVDDEYINHGRQIKNGEIGKDTVIEPVNQQDIINGAIEMEEFMNQKLLINIAKSSNKESLPVVTPNVNGVNHPILRGVDTWVKRKFVEALARCRETAYEQEVDKFNPEKFVMIPSTAIKDPFVVKKDPHKYGIDWLDKILREAA